MIATLKPAKIHSVVSAAIVLAAIPKSDTTQGPIIELVSPPESAPIDQQLALDGLANDPSPRLLGVKNQVWQALQAWLRTNEIGEVGFKGADNAGLRNVVCVDGRACKVSLLSTAVVR